MAGRDRGRCRLFGGGGQLDLLWEELFPAEQARIIQLLLQRVDVKPDGLELRLRTKGLGHVVQELGAIGNELRRTA
jgi:hypothetical protein